MYCSQDDIDEVNKIAHNLKARLDYLAKLNEAALKRKVCVLLLMSHRWKHHPSALSRPAAGFKINRLLLTESSTAGDQSSL